MSKEKKPPYVPTRTCPHRWCKPLHLVPLPFGIAVMAFQMWNNLIFLGFLVVGVAASVWLPRIIHYKPRPRSTPATVRDVVEDLRTSPTAIDLEMQDAKYEGTGWRMLEVRKGWARIAVGCDLAHAALIGLISTAIFTDPGKEAKAIADAEADMTMLISVVIGIGFFAFMLYAHKKATQPRKPKRAWMPAFLRTNV